MCQSNNAKDMSIHISEYNHCMSTCQHVSRGHPSKQSTAIEAQDLLHLVFLGKERCWTLSFLASSVSYPATLALHLKSAWQCYFHTLRLYRGNTSKLENRGPFYHGMKLDQRGWRFSSFAKIYVDTWHLQVGNVQFLTPNAEGLHANTGSGTRDEILHATLC